MRSSLNYRYNTTDTNSNDRVHYTTDTTMQTPTQYMCSSLHYDTTLDTNSNYTVHYATDTT